MLNTKIESLFRQYLLLFYLFFKEYVVNVGWLLENMSEPIAKTHNLLPFQRVFMSFLW